MRANVQCAGHSDIGRVRTQNQDRFHIDADRSLFLVADGMGGAAAGDLAAQTVADMLPEYIRRHVNIGAGGLGPETEDALSRVVQDLSIDIRKGSERSPNLAGMGSTVVVVLVHGGKALIGHLGDSRAYLLRSGQLHQLTDDHTLAQVLIDSGELTAEQAREHSGLRRLTQYVGMRERPVPTVTTVSLDQEDRLLLCTDGLTSMLKDTVIEQIMDTHPHPDHACQALVDAANDSGGSDNITTVIVQQETVHAVAKEEHGPRDGKDPVPALRASPALDTEHAPATSPRYLADDSVGPNPVDASQTTHGKELGSASHTWQDTSLSTPLRLLLGGVGLVILIALQWKRRRP